MVIVLIVAGIAGFVFYNNYKREKYIIEYMREHKELIYNLSEINKTHINFLESYKKRNKDRIDTNIEQKIQSVIDGLHIELEYSDVNIDDTIQYIGEFIRIENITLDGEDYNIFPFKALYIKDYNKNNQMDTIIDFSIKVDKESLLETLNQILDEKILIKMVGASGQLVNGRMQVTSEGSEGRTYNIDEVSDKLDEYTDLVYSELPEDGKLGLNVETRVISIYPTRTDIENINSKLSSFSTGYSSSGAGRKTNIAVASRNLNGVLLLPGESISVDKQIKSRNAKNGYAKAGSYLNGKTVQTYGGGVCQVSTTLYGAVLRAGIIPNTRFAHSMSVGYVPLGLDAAISEGYKDLVFSNPFDSPIYVAANANGGTLTFSIYGAEGLLEGYTYHPGSSSSNGGLRAKSWLNKMKDGQVVEKIDLFSSSYKPHS